MNIALQLTALGAVISGGLITLWLLAGLTIKIARMFWLVRICFPCLYGVSAMVVLLSMMLTSGAQYWPIFLSLLFLFLVVLAVRLPDDLLDHGSGQSLANHFNTQR